MNAGLSYNEIKELIAAKQGDIEHQKDVVKSEQQDLKDMENELQAFEMAKTQLKKVLDQMGD